MLVDALLACVDELHSNFAGDCSHDCLVVNVVVGFTNHGVVAFCAPVTPFVSLLGEYYLVAVDNFAVGFSRKLKLSKGDFHFLLYLLQFVFWRKFFYGYTLAFDAVLSVQVPKLATRYRFLREFCREEAGSLFQTSPNLLFQRRMLSKELYVPGIQLLALVFTLNYANLTSNGSKTDLPDKI